MCYARSTALVFAFCVVLAGASQTRAALVNLNFLGNNGTFDFNNEIGTYVDPTGVQLDFEALVGGAFEAGSDLNATASSFGVNQASTGDVTDMLDIANGLESIRITFTAPPNLNVNLNSITIDDFFGSDAGTWTIAGGAPLTLADGELIDTNFTLMDGQTLVVAATAGNGFSLDGLSFTTTEILSNNPIPEPHSGLLLLCGAAMMMIKERRQRE